MAYPEKGATYRHTPKFIDRMKAAEGHSEGGSIADKWRDPTDDEKGALGKNGLASSLGLGIGAGSGLGLLAGGDGADLAKMAVEPFGMLKAAGVKFKRGGSVEEDDQAPPAKADGQREDMRRGSGRSMDRKAGYPEDPVWPATPGPEKEID